MNQSNQKCHKISQNNYFKREANQIATLDQW